MLEEQHSSEQFFTAHACQSLHHTIMFLKLFQKSGMRSTVCMQYFHLYIVTLWLWGSKSSTLSHVINSTDWAYAIAVARVQLEFFVQKCATKTHWTPQASCLRILMTACHDVALGIRDSSLIVSVCKPADQSQFCASPLAGSCVIFAKVVEEKLSLAIFPCIFVSSTNPGDFWVAWLITS